VSVAAEVTSGGRLFQRRLSATENVRSPTVDSRISLAVRMTTTGDGGGWNRRRAGCSLKDTVAPDHAGIGKWAQPTGSQCFPETTALQWRSRSIGVACC